MYGLRQCKAGALLRAQRRSADHHQRVLGMGDSERAKVVVSPRPNAAFIPKAAELHASVQSQRIDARTNRTNIERTICYSDWNLKNRFPQKNRFAHAYRLPMQGCQIGQDFPIEREIWPNLATLYPCASAGDPDRCLHTKGFMEREWTDAP